MSTAATPTLVHYHAPNTRSSTIRWLLEELGAPHEQHVVDFERNEQREPAYLAVNPMGKVPAIRHNGVLVTELGAICTYLADAFPAAGLAPPIGDPDRGPYLRWMFFYGNCVEPAIVDKALKREPGRPSMMPYGDFETTVETLAVALRPGPFLLGSRFTAADVLMGSGVTWTTMFGLLPKLPEFDAYIAAVTARPANQRATAADQKLAEALKSRPATT